MRSQSLALLVLLTACGQAEEQAQPEQKAMMEAPTEPALVDLQITNEDAEQKIAQFRHEVAELKRLQVAALESMRNTSFKVYFTNTEGSKSRIGNNPGPAKLCAAMREVGLGCSYDERITFTQYLAANGNNLFVCGDGSNPFFRSKSDCRDEDEGNSFYIGQPGQSTILEQSIRKNSKLFKDGDLTPEAARKWQI